MLSSGIPCFGLGAMDAVLVRGQGALAEGPEVCNQEPMRGHRRKRQSTMISKDVALEVVGATKKASSCDVFAVKILTRNEKDVHRHFFSLGRVRIKRSPDSE